MENHEFDSALRDFVNTSEMPYDASAWRSMSHRLRAHEGGNAIKPAVRIIPLRRWAATGIAACLLVIAGWYLKSLQSSTEKDAVGRMNRSAITQPQQPSNVTPYDVPNQTPQETTAAISKKEATPGVPVRPSAFRNVLQSGTDNKAAQPIAYAQQPVVDTQAAGIETPVVSIDAVTSDPKRDRPAPIPYGLLPEHDMSEENEREVIVRKTTYGINGGYNVGSGRNNFTVGVNVRRELGRRLHLETGLAVVGGTNKSYEQQTQTMLVFVPNSGTNIVPASIDTQYVMVFEEVNNNLLYLQAAPTLSYELFKGFSAGGGMDVQRLLTSAEKSVALNSVGQHVQSQPQWDFGLTARMDYQLAKKLRSGVAYRESVGAITKGTAGTAKRSYLLIQLSYTLF